MQRPRRPTAGHDPTHHRPKMPESARPANDSRHFSGGSGPDGAIRVVWDEPQRRIAPGQSVVFYDLDDTRVLGGGIAG